MADLSVGYFTRASKNVHLYGYIVHNMICTIPNVIYCKCKFYVILMQVISWQAGCDEFCVSSVPLRIRSEDNAMDNPMSQKMIVCHDMMGGYINDKFVQGSRCASGVT